MRPANRGAKPIESDELFSILLEFAGAVKAASPKRTQPKSRPALSAVVKTVMATTSPGSKAAGHTESAESLKHQLSSSPLAPPVDPMLSRLQRQGTVPSLGGLEPAEPGAPALVAAAVSTGGPPKGAPKQTREVDKRLQERLQRRFERAQSKPSGLSSSVPQ